METAVQIPAGFRYRDVFLKGRPVHEKYDPFTLRHPPMPASRWAKIYAPFDALRGFKDSIARKTVQYEEQRILSEEECEKINQVLLTLKELVWSVRTDRQQLPKVSVTYYRPCLDVDSEAYGCMGTYETVTGICRRIDTDVLDTIRIDRTDILIRDITQIRIFPRCGSADIPWD